MIRLLVRHGFETESWWINFFVLVIIYDGLINVKSIDFGERVMVHRFM